MRSSAVDVNIYPLSKSPRPHHEGRGIRSQIDCYYEESGFVGDIITRVTIHARGEVNLG